MEPRHFSRDKKKVLEEKYKNYFITILTFLSKLSLDVNYTYNAKKSKHPVCCSCKNCLCMFIVHCSYNVETITLYEIILLQTKL